MLKIVIIKTRLVMLFQYLPRFGPSESTANADVAATDVTGVWCSSCIARVLSLAL